MYSPNTHTAHRAGFQLGLVAKPNRPIQPLGEWGKLFDFSKVRYIVEPYKANGNTYDTLNLMAKYAKEQAADFKSLTDSLAATSLKKTLNNYWQWVYNHVAYVDDGPVEIVRKPLTTVKEQKGDCDCMTTLLSAMMLSKGIKHALRKAKYIQDNGQVGDWQHVYAVVPINQANPDYDHVITLDCVLDTFNQEHDNAKVYDKEMKIQGLGSLPAPTQLPVINSLQQVHLIIEQTAAMGKQTPELAKHVSPMIHLLNNWGSKNQRIHTSRELAQINHHPHYAALHNLIVALEKGDTAAYPKLSEQVMLTSPVTEYELTKHTHSLNGLGLNLSEEQGNGLIAIGGSLLDKLLGGNKASTLPAPTPYYPPVPPPSGNDNKDNGTSTALIIVGGVLVTGLIVTTIVLATRKPAKK